MKVIDAHAHVGRSIYGQEQDVESLLADMDNHQVDITVVAAFTPPDLDFSRANREVARAVQAHPDRLVGCVRVDPRLKEASNDEIRRAAETDGFRGIVLDPLEQGFKANHRLVHAVMELADQLDLFVHFTTGYPVVGTPMQVADLARRYSSVPVVLGRMGGDAYFGDAVEAAALYSNLYLGTDGHLLTGIAKNGLRLAINAVGAERILFASDSPYFNLGIERLRINVADLPDDARAAVLGGNALYLLAMEDES